MKTRTEPRSASASDESPNKWLLEAMRITHVSLSELGQVCGITGPTLRARLTKPVGSDYYWKVLLALMDWRRENVVCCIGGRQPAPMPDRAVRTRSRQD